MTEKAPERFETARLLLRRPIASDCEAMFARYASVAAVVRYVSWPRHRSVADTRSFLAFSDAAWQTWPGGPYLVLSREDGSLLGGTGLDFEAPQGPSIGYVLAQDAWGRGIATETARAMLKVAGTLGVSRVHSVCHVEHAASARVLEKAGFALEGTLRRHTKFPNLGDGGACDVYLYTRSLDA